MNQWMEWGSLGQFSDKAMLLRSLQATRVLFRKIRCVSNIFQRGWNHQPELRYLGWALLDWNPGFLMIWKFLNEQALRIPNPLVCLVSNEKTHRQPLGPNAAPPLPWGLLPSPSHPGQRKSGMAPPVDFHKMWARNVRILLLQDVIGG